MEQMKTARCLMLMVVMGGALHGSPLRTAELSRVVNDVRLSERQAAARQARVGERLGGQSTLLTGRDSRAELSFPDRTVTRIGSNSVFRFRSGSRDMEIDQGSFLLQVPGQAGGATIRTATVTAGIAGTTTMMEYSPGKWLKFVTLEGKASLRNRAGKTVEIGPGMMLVMHPDAEEFPRPVVINLRKLVKTSRLMDERFFGPLGGEAVGLINGVVEEQLASRRRGDLLPTGALVRGPRMSGGGIWGNRGVLPSGAGGKRMEGDDPSYCPGNAGGGEWNQE